MWLLWILPLAAPFLLPAAGEVVNSFDSCSQFFLGGNPPNLVAKNPARICQVYEGLAEFATMYDRRRRIPIFSAYRLFNSSSGRRIPDWKIEPQLAVHNNSRISMESEQNCGISPNLLENSQAVSSDYANASPYSKGHLAPVSHQLDESSMNATFTLTNIVPQFALLNNGQWNVYEQKIIQNTIGCPRNIYVIVGVVPGNTLLKSRVNIPSHIWAAICCVLQSKRKKSWAVIARNNKNKVTWLTLKQLEKDLSGEYKQSINLFNSACY